MWRGKEILGFEPPSAEQISVRTLHSLRSVGRIIGPLNNGITVLITGSRVYFIVSILRNLSVIP